MSTPDACPVCGTPWVEHDGPTRLCKRLAEAEAERDALRAELEREHMRLAACGVVAMSDTPESAKRNREMHPDYYSASCSDVAHMVDRLMALRAALEAVEWVRLGRKDGACPWCGNLFEEGHAPDCPRQRALGLTP